MAGDRTAEVLRSVAANVRRARQRLGLTQEKLGDLAGIDLSYVQRVERGTVNLSVGKLVALADALQTNPGLLLRRAAPLPPPKRGRPPRGSR